MARDYDVAAVEVIAESESVRVRQFTMRPGEAVPWHRHTRVRDVILCLSGQIAIEEEGLPPRTLEPGQRCDIAAGIDHRVVNAHDAEAVYMLIQSGGAYDFVKRPDAAD